MNTQDSNLDGFILCSEEEELVPNDTAFGKVEDMFSTLIRDRHGSINLARMR